MTTFFNSNGNEYALLSIRKDYCLIKSIKTEEYIVAWDLRLNNSGKDYSWGAGTYFGSGKDSKKKAVEYYKEKTDEKYLKKISGYERLLDNLKNYGAKEALESLTSGIVCLSHRHLDPSEKEKIKDVIGEVFLSLDKEGVSFRLQNAVIDKAEQFDLSYKQIIKEIYKDYDYSERFLKTFIKEQCPSLKHLSKEGRENLKYVFKENMYKKNFVWQDLKEYISETPEYKELRDEIVTCKIKEQKIINQNKNLLQEMSV